MRRSRDNPDDPAVDRWPAEVSAGFIDFDHNSAGNAGSNIGPADGSTERKALAASHAGNDSKIRRVLAQPCRHRAQPHSDRVQPTSSNSASQDAPRKERGAGDRRVVVPGQQVWGPPEDDLEGTGQARR